MTSKITTKGVDVIDLALAHQNTPTRQARGAYGAIRGRQSSAVALRDYDRIF